MQRTSPGRRCKLRNLHIAMLIAITMVLTSLLVTVLIRRDDHEVHVVTLENPLPRNNPMPTTAAELIAALAATTRRAAAGATLSQSSCHEQHPCASRHEIYTLYNNRSGNLAPNFKWAALLREYAALHRACVARMGGDVEGFFLRRRRVDGCRFVVAGVSAGSGVGKKALSVVAALVYAVVTQRVLLVPGAFGGAFCEPFEGSSWMVDPQQRWTQSKKRRDLWAPVAAFNEKVDGGIRDVPIYAVATTEDWDAQPTARFFCDTEQAHYEDVDWINFRNNFYFVPKLFAVESFRALLEDVFPDRNVLTHVLRTAFLPCDAVWARVRRVRDAHIWHGSVGVQERYFDGKRDFLAATEDHVRDCLTQYIRPSPSSTIFVTSLYKNQLQSRTQYQTVVQLSHEETQRFGLEVDMQALTEILCLSLTDHLILTPLSTLGALAQGYGALVPWFIDLRPETTTPCVRALSRETCYQLPATKLFTCPHDVSVNGRVMTDVVPYLVDCHVIETPRNGGDLGLQLITEQTM